MLGVEDVGSSITTSTFLVSTATPITTTTTTAAPAVATGTGVVGVGLLPLVATGTGVDSDPRTLLVSVSTVGGSNPTTNNAGIVTTPPSNNNNVTANPAVMDQVEEFVKPIMKDGEMILEVECGQNKAAMYLSKLCQGSKGPCINFQGSWLTPNEFQFVSGRETAKDWKRSIRHHGKSLKLLLAKGILTVHPTMCDCEGCRIGAVLTRKGEKRRIPNGERKRKSTGSAPENSGNGAFRALANGSAAVKNQDGPTDPKRMAVDKVQEGGQSPLKESSMMNLPESKDVVPHRLSEAHIPDVSKMAVDNRLGPNLMMPHLSTDRTSDINNSMPAAVAAVSSPVPAKDAKDSMPVPRPSNDKHRHGSGSSIHSSSSQASDPGSASSDVKVLSSSGVSSKADKSLSRLALYQAVSASVKGEIVCGDRPEGPSGPAGKCETRVQKDDGSSSGPGCRDSKDAEVRSVKKETKDFSMTTTSVEMQAKPFSAESDCMDSTSLKAELRLPVSDNIRSTASHSRPCESSSSSSNSSSSSSGSSTSSSSSNSPPNPLSSTAAATSSPLAPAQHAPHPRPNPALSNATNSDKEDRHKQPLSSPPLPSPSSSGKSSDKGNQHLTIRHPSPDRRVHDTAPVTKHSSSVTKHSSSVTKLSSSVTKQHSSSATKQHSSSVTKHSPVKAVRENSSEKARDRKQDSSSSSSSERDRHSSRENESSTRHISHHEREGEKRRADDRWAEKERKSGIPSGSGTRSEDATYSRGPEFCHAGVGGGRAEGIAAPVQAAVPAAVSDPAAFSEYMRVLAAGHHGLVTQPTSCIPAMFPLRPPTDVSVSAGLLHPMHAAACGMFSAQSAMMPKDPVLYSTTAGTLPTASYGYGAPGMTPLLMAPQYQAAASTSMLDYSRPFSYIPWSGSLPLMMPDAMAAAAAAAAAANSSAKRNRDEMESASEMNSKRLQQQLPMAMYGAGSIAPIDYMAAYRGLATPLTCGMESSMYDKSAEYMRKRMYPDLAASASGSVKGMDSPYLASLPDYYRSLYCCRCMENRPGDIRTWGVEDVVKLVSSLDGCSVYTETFREQRVDGKILVLLNTDHLMKNLGMKLGPAMSLTNRVAKILLDSTRASGCETCRRLASMVPSVQSTVGY